MAVAIDCRMAQRYDLMVGSRPKLRATADEDGHYCFAAAVRCSSVLGAPNRHNCDGLPSCTSSFVSRIAYRR
jgi:hypothetical protein